MTALPDDERTASGIFVSLSSQLMAGAFAVLGVEAAILGFIIERKSPGPLFWLALLCSIAAVVLIIASAYNGGLGISEIAKEGYNGRWSLSPQQGRFRSQKQLMIFATTAVYLSVALAVAAPSKPEDGLTELRDRVSRIEGELKSLRAQPAPTKPHQRRLPSGHP